MDHQTIVTSIFWRYVQFRSSCFDHYAKQHFANGVGEVHEIHFIVLRQINYTQGNFY